MVEELVRTRYVYHYTSLETFFAIMENYRRDKSALTFRASNIFNFNDPKEMEVGYEALKEVLPKYEADRGISEFLRLSAVYEDEDCEKKCKEDYLKAKDKNVLEFGIVPYTICFSLRRDYLPMWSLYGKMGHGLCLKFDAYKMMTEQMLSDITPGIVAYNKKSAVKLLKDDVGLFYFLYTNAINKNTDTSIEGKISGLATLCHCLSPFVKHKDYQYEKEFRLVYNKYYGIDFGNYSAREHLFSKPMYKVKPYINIPISPLSLKKVILGPCMDIVMKDVLKVN